MASGMSAYPSIASKPVCGIRVVLCDPDDDVRARLREFIEADPLLVVVAESRDWATCEADLEDLVPELLIARNQVVPLNWGRGEPDILSPLLITLTESAGNPLCSGSSYDLPLPLDAPVVKGLLARAVTEIYDRKAKQLLFLVGRYVAGSKPAFAYESFVPVERDGEYTEIRTQTIMAIVAARKCVTLHTQHGRTMLREPIYQIATKLDPSIFVRVHRSVIINCRHIDGRFLRANATHVVLVDGSRYPVGRNYREALAALLACER
jgi:hypothetical protein